MYTRMNRLDRTYIQYGASRGTPTELPGPRFPALYLQAQSTRPSRSCRQDVGKTLRAVLASHTTAIPPGVQPTSILAHTPLRLVSASYSFQPRCNPPPELWTTYHVSQQYGDKLRRGTALLLGPKSRQQDLQLSILVLFYGDPTVTRVPRSCPAAER